MLDRIGIRGFTWWESVQGRGSVDGEPRRGTHTWPEMNSALITVVPDEKVGEILARVRKINAVNEEVGIRAFVWNIEETV
jgi:nitrogen regulatory protein PII